MAPWILNCPNCGADFFHSEVAADRGLLDWVTPKPEFPKGGLQMDCPICKIASLFQRYQLLYSAS
jgi:hypothetical protein